MNTLKYSKVTIAALLTLSVYMVSQNKVTLPPQSVKSMVLEKQVVVLATDTVIPKLVSTDKPKVKPRIQGDVHAFMKRLGRAEGLGSYNTVSRTGYLGLYQFHPKTLRGLGFNVSPQEFLASPAIQDSAMLAYMRDNARSLRKVINKFNGTIVNDVYVTKAGILAGAHLVGSGGILAFFYPERYNYRVVDGNGVHVAQYMTKFAGYDLQGL